MLENHNIPAAYQKRRAALAMQLCEVKSVTLKKQLGDAIFLSDAVISTAFDLAKLSQNAAAYFNSEIKSNLERTQFAAAQLTELTADVADLNSEQNEDTSIYPAAIILLQASQNIDGFKIADKRSQLFKAVLNLWLEIMECLFEADDRRIFFARIELLVGYASSKLPGIGDALEVLKTAAEFYAIQKKQAQDTDNYLLSLESYNDAANVLIIGILAYCENVERSLAGADEPTHIEVDQRIAAHFAKLVATTRTQNTDGAV